MASSPVRHHGYCVEQQATLSNECFAVDSLSPNVDVELKPSKIFQQPQCLKIGLQCFGTFPPWLEHFQPVPRPASHGRPHFRRVFPTHAYCSNSWAVSSTAGPSHQMKCYLSHALNPTGVDFTVKYVFTNLSQRCRVQVPDQCAERYEVF